MRAARMTPPLLPKPKRPVVRGPRERWNQVLVRIRQLEGDPHRIALGLAVGVFVSLRHKAASDPGLRP